jgi:hypothetical protein
VKQPWLASSRLPICHDDGVGAVPFEQVSVGEMQWLEREICDSSDSPKRQMTQQKMSWSVTPHVCPAIPEGSPGEVPVISCPENRMQVMGHGEWSRWKIPVARTARVVSQNVGPLGVVVHSGR